MELQRLECPHAPGTVLIVLQVSLFFLGGGEVCHVTCGVFIPLSGIELGPTLISESIDKVLITGLPESSPKCQFFRFTKQPCRNPSFH